VTPSETRSWARVRVDRKVDSDAGPNREFQAEKGRQQRSESCEVARLQSLRMQSASGFGLKETA